MTTDEIMQVVGKVIADELAVLREDLEARIDRAIAAKAVPPFLPPPVWTVGRHGAGNLVRHRNGLFLARRDTAAEPPDESWLPILVGVAGLDLRFQSERELSLRAALSDGTIYEMVHHIALPIVRGYWDVETEYVEGDRVFRYGEFHALKASKGLEPGKPGSEAAWLLVGGKYKAEGHAQDFRTRVEQIIAREVLPLFERVGDRLVALEKGTADADSR